MFYKTFAKVIFSKWPALHRVIMYLGLNKDYEVRSYLELIQPGETVFDVGANVGRFTEWFSYRVGPKGHVHAFEPVTQNFQRLESRLSSRKNICFNQCLVGDHNGIESVYALETDGAQSSMKRQNWGNWSETSQANKESCSMFTLDSYCFKHTSCTPRFIKIDAEGAELHVLQGAVQLLHQFHPLLSIEVNPLVMKPFGHTPSDLLYYIQKQGYNHFQLITHVGIIDLHPEKLDQMLEKHFSPNLLCFPK